MLFLFLGIPVQEDNGIVQGKHQLHDAHNGKRKLGNIREYHIGPDIHRHRNPDVHQDNHRFKPGVAHHQQHQQHQSDGNCHHIRRQHRYIGLVDLPAGPHVQGAVLFINGAV